MSQLQDRITQFRKMANDDPDNELGHYRLGQLLMEAQQYPEAIQSFRRTLELSPRFSKVYHLLAQSLLANNQRDETIALLKQGYETADEQGDNMPRDAMARMLVELGEPEPVSKKTTANGPANEGGFRCQRPGCSAGAMPINSTNRLIKTKWVNAFTHLSVRTAGWIGCELQYQGHQRTPSRPEHGTRSGRVRSLHARVLRSGMRRCLMDAQEYLVSFGLTGAFGRFRAAVPLALRRGERVVVRGPRGVEVAEVLRQATPRHAEFLPNTSVGTLLRRLTAEDERAAMQMEAKGQQLFERGRQLAAELEMPLELLDVEMLLDGQHALLHHLRWADADVRPFVSTLSREFELHVALVDLSQTHETANHEDDDAHEGCGRPNCGQEGGGCGSCGSGGGCGTCGQATPPNVEPHFAQLREQMEHRRTALL